MKKRSTLFALSLFFILLIPGLVSSQNPAYVEETFTYEDYPYDAESITELSEGSGWSDSWTMQDGDAITFTITKGVAEVVGNAIRTFETPLIDNGEEDIWIYVKLKSGTASEAGYAGVSLFNGENEDFYIGQEWNKVVNAVRGGGWGGPNFTTTVDAMVETVFLIKIETMGSGEDENTYVWINPVINNAVPSDLEMTGSFAFSMPETYERLSLRSDQTIFCDFIKIGTDIEKILGFTSSSNQLQKNNFHLNNYPNPAKGKTIINYTLPETGTLKVEVFDTWGKIVKTYTNLDSHAGYHQVEIDATDLHPGLYYYKLSQKSMSMTKKMVVLK